MEYVALERLDWYNHRRLPRPIGDIPPAEKELAHYRQNGEPAIEA